MDDTRPLSDLPKNVRQQIAIRFDQYNTPNWQTLIGKMPKNLYSEKAILKFYLAILQPQGSPTLLLLNDLTQRKKTIGELKSWIDSLQSFSDLVCLLENRDFMAPTIITQPESHTVDVGSTVRVLVETQGSQPIQYQWFKGMTKLFNETRTTLVFNDTNVHDSGYYICRIHNPIGFVFTNWIQLNVASSLCTETSDGASCVENSMSINSKDEGYFNHTRQDLPNPSSDSPFPSDSPIPNNSLILPPTATEVRRASFDGNEIERVIVLTNHSFDEGHTTDENKIENNYADLAAPQNYDSTMSSEATDSLTMFDTAGIQSTSNSIRSIRKENLCIRLSNPRGRYPYMSTRPPIIKALAIPTQKVALIIGNQDYDHADTLGVLNQPQNDAHDLASTLISMDFKVVSLMNLTLSAMDDALTYFYNLLDVGTYALFYFAGHGFESGNEGYLVPTDARNYHKDDCFPLSALLVAMTKRAKLSVLLVDSCRTDPRTPGTPENPLPLIWSTADQATMNIEHKNVIIGYSCCSNGRAMESPQLRNGFFAQYLLEHIWKVIKIEDVLFEVSKDMANANIIDPDTGRPQIVFRMSTVVEDLRLTDPCVPAEESSDQIVLWEQANIAPESPVTVLENEFISIKLVFTAEFSNSLRIQSVITKLNTNFCEAQFILPNQIGTCPVQIIAPDPVSKSGNVRYARICNLERLRGDITIHVMVTYDAGDVIKEQGAYYCIKEKPLYAKIATKIAGIQ